MARPDVHDATDALWSSLPELYQAADEAQADGPNGYPLLRFLSLIVDQWGEVLDLVGRIDYYSHDDGGAPGDTSDLADPYAADAAWLPWLAQLVGAQLPAGLTVADQRAAIAGALAGFLKGTKAGIAAAAATVLTGTKYVLVRPLFGGDRWTVELRTRTTETPGDAAVLAAVLAQKAKPAGLTIVVTHYAASWAAIEAAHPTWASIEAAGSWAVLEESGAP
jgi:hypothetical protein